MRAERENALVQYALSASLENLKWSKLFLNLPQLGVSHNHILVWARNTPIITRFLRCSLGNQTEMQRLSSGNIHTWIFLKDSAHPQTFIYVEGDVRMYIGAQNSQYSVRRRQVVDVAKKFLLEKSAISAVRASCGFTKRVHSWMIN